MDKRKVLLTLRQIKASDYGKDFIEYLEYLSLDNYKSFKNSDIEMSEIHKGYAICVDNLITLFGECDKVVEEKKDIPSWN